MPRCPPSAPASELPCSCAPSGRPDGRRILLNSRRRPSVCNAAETLLYRRSDRRNGAVFDCWPPCSTPVSPCHLGPDEADLRREYLSLDIAVAVVDGVDAIAHIHHGTGHTEAIVTTNLGMRPELTEQIDAAAAMVNASTAFTDGEQFGFGAEIGIHPETHARGPMGLN